MKKMLILVVASTVVVVAVWWLRASRSGYESAAYTTVRTDLAFALRDYPALCVIETSMGEESNGGDGSFMRLFRFITGSNHAQQKIAMTTPVLMTGHGTNRTMAFVLPAQMQLNQVPAPSEATVRVRPLAAGRFAVLRFTGGRSVKRELESLQRLQAWVVAQGLRVGDEPIYGYFDPPWTPSFLRHNEVMLRVEAP